MIDRLVYTAIFAAGLWYVFTTNGPKDETDPPDGRSGLTLRTDAATGCQYLEGGGGGITPRLGPDGRPWCVGR